MIETIAHIADVHIRKTPTRSEEYQQVFKRLIASLTIKKPDRIVIVGDLVHDYLDLQGEQLILASDLLNELSKIAQVRVTRGNHDCFTGDHEILTKDGWKTLVDYINLGSDMEVLTFNPNNEHLEFQMPDEKVVKQFKGNLKQFRTNKCEFKVTPTHEILLHQYSNNSYVKKYADTVDLNSDYRIPLRSKEIIDGFDKWFELLGFCLADATFVIKNQNTMNGRVQFHFKKERKINYLCDLLSGLKIPYKLRDGDKKRNTKVICIYSQYARDIMKFFNYKKELSYEMGLLNQSKFKIKSFINGYLSGDGSLIENDRYACATIYNQNAEILTTISNYVGYSGYVQDSDVFGNYGNSKRQYIFFIIINNDSKTTQIEEITDIQYDGNVYCLTVPNENLFIRYKGRPFITGNCRKKNLKRVDSVKAIVETLHNPNVIYFDSTGFFDDENVTWAVWHHGEKNNNPWKTKEGKLEINRKSNARVYIDLFHDPITGCKSTTGFEMSSKSYYKISDFKGDFSFFGDIHRMQYFDKAKTKGFCGSLIAQDVTEGDENFHGYLLWDVKNHSVEEVSIANDYSFKNVKITPYTDFEDLDFEIENPTKHMKIRFVWGTLPQTRSKDSERKLIEYVKTKYNNVNVVFSHKNEFLETEKIDVSENVTLENVTSKEVQHEIFKEFLTKIGVEESVIADVIALDEEILSEIDVTDDVSVEWNVIKFGGNNFMSYEKLDIDWRDMDGLFQITGINTAGKTTIMKLISYVLFGKTLETESRMKFGDKRFVNNRNGAKFCDAYLVIEANGEYYGIKKKTELSVARDGTINGAPTTLSYYMLSTPDDEMNDETSLDKLDEDRRVKTQKKIENIVGSYDNFMRIVMTTSDTLNRILSNDMAVFIDSLLFDSGLDIFDKKLEGWKVVNKRVNEKQRLSCNIEATTQLNAILTQEITDLNGEINQIETIKLPEVQENITKGRKYVEDLTKKLFKIDPEIYNLNVDDTKADIGDHNRAIVDLRARKAVIEENIKPLKETYDVEKLNKLTDKKDAHKTNEYNFKLEIKGFEQIKTDEEHKIEIINGDIFRLKEEGVKLKREIADLKNSKNCSQCGQVIEKQEHKDHISKSIKEKEERMFSIADQIKAKENVDKLKHQKIINTQISEIARINGEIEKLSLAMENILKEIGVITNDKNDVEKRKELQIELDQIPTKIENEKLNIQILQQKIDNYDNSLKQIEENQKIEKGITAAKLRLTELETDEASEREDIYIRKTQIGEKQLKIMNNKILIEEFKLQEYRDMVMELYKKCVHRDGIPRQMLVNYIIPKINLTLESILSVVPFKVWLDIDDLRPKLVYNNRPTAVIDCISASGKERTFSSVVLKFALNQINVKAKPTIFLLDEVMGKLDENSVEEFVELLHTMKTNTKRILIIEHNAEINPDYLISVELNEDGISSLILE